MLKAFSKLISRISEVTDFKRQIVDDFEKAMEFYLQKDFLKASEIFNNLSLLDDKPSKVYLQRCKEYLQNPPEENWDGIYTLNEK